MAGISKISLRYAASERSGEKLATALRWMRACSIAFVHVIGIPIYAAAHAETKGFVVTWFAPAIFQDGTECPQGFADSPDMEEALSRLPAQERDELVKRGGTELQTAIKRRGPEGQDVCEFPQSVPDPGFKTVQGKRAYGLNLDGADNKSPGAGNTCRHKNFVSPSGERGIDNQWYRVEGCIESRRLEGFVRDFHNAQMLSGEFSILIEVQGFDTARPKGRVQVGIYAGGDPVATSSRGIPLPDASIQVHPDSAYHALVSATVENGILTTEPADIRLKADTTIGGEFLFRDARLRLELQPDGNITGILAGYQDLERIYNPAKKSPGAEIIGKMNCPGYFNALQRLADGYLDPKTGKCTAISSAYELKGIPAFVIHPAATIRD